MISQEEFDIMRANVPRLSEYFGIWGIRDVSLRRAIGGLRGIDWPAHVAQSAAQSTPANLSPQSLSPGVGVVQLTGPLTKHASSLGDGTSTIAVRAQIRAALRDDSIGRIALLIESPGGTIAGIDELAKDVAKAAKEKPVFAFIEDSGLSAAYWVASQATRIFANETGMVGSIGVFSVLTDSSGLDKKDGVTVHVVRSGKFKGIGTPGSEVTEEHLEHLQELIDATHSHFLTAIESGRGISAKSLAEIADGRAFIAEKALALGLIDEIGTFDAFLSDLQNENTPGGAKAEAGFNIQTEAKESGNMAENTGTPAAPPVAPEPQAATVKEMQAEFGEGVNPQFLVNQLAAGATLEKAKSARLAQIGEELKAAKDETAKAKETAKVQGAAAIGDDGKGKPKASMHSGGPARDQWGAEISERMSAGANRAAAIRAVAVDNPDLHAAYLAEMNAG